MTNQLEGFTSRIFRVLRSDGSARRLACLFLLAQTAWLAGTVSAQDSSGLPELQGAQADRPEWNIDAGQIGTGIWQPSFVWSAEVQAYQSPAPTLTMQAGSQLTDRIGIGSVASVGRDGGELVLSLVGDLPERLRLRVSLGHLLAADGGAWEDGTGLAASSQTSANLSASKTLNLGGANAVLGISVFRSGFAGEAVQEENAEWNDDGADMQDSFAPDQMSGSLSGVEASVFLHASETSAIEFALGRTTMIRRFEEESRQDRTYGSLRFNRRFGACVWVRGGLSMDGESRHLDAQIGRGAWSLDLSHGGDGESTASFVGVSYSIPLDGRPARVSPCMAPDLSSESHPTIADTAAERPPALPTESPFIDP